MPTKKWTEEEEEFLRDNFMTLSNAELAEKYDITKNAVQKKLARMGLKRSQAAKEPPPVEVPEEKTVEEPKPAVVSAESHLFLGDKLFYEERDYEQAIEEYNQAAKEEPNALIKLKARYWMAESHVKLGNIKDAIKIFSKIAGEPEDSHLRDSAARSAMSLGSM